MFVALPIMLCWTAWALMKLPPLSADGAVPPAVALDLHHPRPAATPRRFPHRAFLSERFGADRLIADHDQGAIARDQLVFD